MIITCVVKYQVKEGQVEAFAKEIREKQIEQRFSAQPGNICFRYGTPLNEKDVMYLTDAWESKEAFEAHLSCDVKPDWDALKAKYVTGSEALKYECTAFD